MKLSLPKYKVGGFDVVPLIGLAAAAGIGYYLYTNFVTKPVSVVQVEPDGSDPLAMVDPNTPIEVSPDEQIQPNNISIPSAFSAIRSNYFSGNTAITDVGIAGAY